MNAATLRQRLKVWMLPIAMLCGVLFHNLIGAVQFIAPYLIFLMLLITFCRIDLSQFRFTRLTWSIVSIQVIGSITICFALLPFNPDLAQGALICILCPTATAAPVITAMLGGSISALIAISVLSNLAAAIIAPIMFTLVGSTSQIAFLSTFITILLKVVPIILVPLISALILRKIAPRVHQTISSHQSLSFYIWAISLVIVVGKAVTFVIDEPSDKIPEMIALAAIAGLACIAQFAIGRKIGCKYGDRIAGAQGLGQKNTVLAVWLAVNFLNPISSIAPAAYIAWQNIINSYQIYLKSRK